MFAGGYRIGLELRWQDMELYVDASTETWSESNQRNAKYLWPSDFRV